MKLIVNNKTLKRALKKLKDIVPKNPALPILENILFEASESSITITATDLEVTVIIAIESDVAVEKPIKSLIPFLWLNSISNIHGELPLVLNFNKKSLSITGENDVFKQDSLHPVKNYPQLPVIPNEAMVSMNNNFIDRLNSALLTCDAKGDNPVLSKIGMEIMGNKINIASTNANTLFTYSFPAETVNETEVMVSPKIVKALDGFTETSIYWNDTHLAFESSNMKVIATRPEGKYLNYRAVIPNNKSNLTIGRKDLLDALDKVMLVNDHQCTFHLKIEDAAGIRLTSEKIDYNRDATVEVNVITKYTGETPTILLSPGKLQSLLLQVDYDQIDLAIYEPTKAVLLRAESDDAYLGLIMPLAPTE